MNYNIALAPPFRNDGNGHYSELFIRANWDVNTDLQYDPNATSWYVDGNYNFGFNLSTSNENVNFSKFIDGGEQGRNVLNDSSSNWDVSMDPSDGSYSGFSIGNISGAPSNYYKVLDMMVNHLKFIKLLDFLI